MKFTRYFFSNLFSMDELPFARPSRPTQGFLGSPAGKHCSCEKFLSSKCNQIIKGHVVSVMLAINHFSPADFQEQPLCFFDLPTKTTQFQQENTTYINKNSSSSNLVPLRDHSAVWGCNNDRRYPNKQNILPHVGVPRFFSPLTKKDKVVMGSRD